MQQFGSIHFVPCETQAEMRYRENFNSVVFMAVIAGIIIPATFDAALWYGAVPAALMATVLLGAIGHYVVKFFRSGSLFITTGSTIRVVRDPLPQK